MSIRVEDLRAFCIASLEKVGMPTPQATIAAEALVTTDAMGVLTHGTKLLGGYLNRLRGGGYKPAGRPRIDREGPCWAIIDGDSALGQIGCDFAVRTGMAKARSVGVAYIGLKNTGHIGAAGYFAAQAARQGFLTLLTGNDTPSVAAPGSRTAVLGSNPLAYAAPVPGGDPILLDMATAAVAGGKVYAASQRGEVIPSTWLIGPDGLPTTDGSLYPQSAALAPMAAHKGYGLGLFAEIFSGILAGGTVTWQMGSWIFDEPSQPSRHNAGMTLIDIAAIAGKEAYSTRIHKVIDELHAAPTAVGVERVLLPGEREWANRARALTAGIDLPADVIAKIKAAAEEYGIPAPEEI
jgi:LDH2 family malate/lactate/ureidoglycolate dehydrogenase